MSKILNILSKEMQELHDFITNEGSPDIKGEDEIYIFSEELENAVRLAIYLGKPLLVTGEPGTGKTRLAHAVVKKINKSESKTKLRIFNTKTTSTANDLLYTYDHLSHFHYIHKNIKNTEEEITSKFIEENFITINALGEAILSKNRDVVLIDEIDKAPRDLPNDILNVIEYMKFEIPELKLGTDYKNTSKNKDNTAVIVKDGDTKKRPILILTSNSEKSLPEAFLRRCIFFHIELPDEAKLKEILEAKFKKLHNNKIYKHWDIIIEFFLQKREILTRKKPAISELIHWVYVLNDLQFNCEKLKLFTETDNSTSQELSEEEKKALKLSDTDKKHLLLSFTVLAKNVEDLKKIKQIIDVK